MLNKDSQILATQMLIDAAQQYFPDAYVAYEKNVNKVLWLESQDNEGAWGIEIARDGWLIPFKAAPYTPYYNAASRDIEEVLNVVGLLIGDNNESQVPDPVGSRHGYASYQHYHHR